MNYLLVHHRVQNFQKWKMVYDEHLPKRQAAGVKEKNLWHADADPNDVILLFEANDLPKARAFAESDDLAQIMAKAGVIGKPDVTYLKD